MTARIGVTGATGHLGGGVARLLAAAGRPLRLIVRDADRIPDLRGPPTAPGASAADGAATDVQVAIASYAEAAPLTEAFTGLATLYLVSGEESHDRLDQHRTAVRAAVAAGVERIVYTSFLGASPDATFRLARDHFHTERSLAATGIPVVALRNSLYADVLPLFVGDGVLAGPAADGRLAPVARADIIEVSAAALLDDSWDAPLTLDVTGPSLLTLGQIAEELTAMTGAPVRYRAETREQAYASRAHLGAPGWLLDAWVSTYTAIARGEMAVVTDTVERVTGHPATPFLEHRRAARLPPSGARLDAAVQPAESDGR